MSGARFAYVFHQLGLNAARSTLHRAQVNWIAKSDEEIIDATMVSARRP